MLIRRGRVGRGALLHCLGIRTAAVDAEAALRRHRAQAQAHPPALGGRAATNRSFGRDLGIPPATGAAVLNPKGSC